MDQKDNARKCNQANQLHVVVLFVDAVKPSVLAFIRNCGKFWFAIECIHFEG